MAKLRTGQNDTGWGDVDEIEDVSADRTGFVGIKKS
jgi:hypothetical protein